MLNSWGVPSGNTMTPLFEAYTEITALGKFVEMNGEGFRKIVKKYDKTMGTDYTNRYGDCSGWLALLYVVCASTPLPCDYYRARGGDGHFLLPTC